ncbi:hypothetical protein RB195_015937 [Necator americanus]|uniref:Uncharacterized protein n=1 Tax=Necator americanus TaxID=51031 RepID=A0ABR1E6S9_NECAM
MDLEFEMLMKCDDEDEPLCVAKTPIRTRMCYLRKVYFTLSIQQFIIASASFILFMTPGVRPFVQHYTSTTCTTALALIVSFFCLRHAANHAPRLAGLSFFLFTLVLALTCAVATTYFGTEMVYTDGFRCNAQRLRSAQARPACDSSRTHSDESQAGVRKRCALQQKSS